MANEYNLTLFQEQIDAAGIPNVGVNTSGVVWPPDGVTYTAPQLATIEAVRAAHNPNRPSQQQLQETARNIALRQGKAYLRNQLLAASPNLATIFTKLKEYIDSNADLLRMQNNSIDAMSLAYGWNAANVKAAAAGSSNAVKAQYLESVKSIIGLLG